MTLSSTLRASAAFSFALTLADAASAEIGLDAGRTIFTETAEPNCTICHTLADAGSEGEIGPKLDELKPTAEMVRAALTSGVGVMPAYRDILSEEEIATVSAYVAEVTGGAENTGTE